MRLTHLSAISLAVLMAACGRSNDAPMQASGGGGAPVQTAPPNKRDATPAFPGQTRAPEHKSNVSINVQEIVPIDQPWAIAMLPEGDMLVTSKPGKLYRVSNGQASEVNGAPPVDAGGQGGLLDVSLAPDFATSRTIYLSFSEPRGGKTNSTSLFRAKLSADGKSLEGGAVIFHQNPAWESSGHFGSNIEWDGNGNLYLTVGDRQQPEPRQLAQDLTKGMGKVFRLKPDGTPADGNPFAGRADAQPEIWSYGHRNVQGAAINPATGKLWTIEHGPRGGDEINIPDAGKNYGWPIICYCIDYPGGPIGEGITAKDGLEQPIYYWDPVIAPADLIFYSGKLFTQWKDNVLIAALGSGALVRLEINGDRVTGEERLLTDRGRLRDIMEGPDGAIYVITEGEDGKLMKLTPG